MRLEGKVALITGAATGVRGELMGIGGATAWLFSREGARLIIADINDGLGERTAADIRESGGDATFVHLDVRSEESWQRAMEEVSRLGRLDILVNNAGTAAGDKIENTTVEEGDEQMAVHARGAFLGCKYAIPEMRRAGGGSIINISSMHGIVGTYTVTAYQAAKSAMRSLAKAAAVQYASEGIRVNSVHPGYILTPLTRSFLTPPEELASRVAEVPLGRIAVAEEIAQVILYLASDESSYVTGTELIIDGGVTAQ